MRKIFVLLLSTMMLLTIIAPIASAESKDITTRNSDLIESYSITISCNDDGLLTAKASLRANTAIERLGFPVIRIERKDGSSWTTVAVVYGKYKYAASRYDYSITHQGTAGDKYRAYAEFYAKNGTMTDSRNKTSTTVTGK